MCEQMLSNLCKLSDCALKNVSCCSVDVTGPGKSVDVSKVKHLNAITEKIGRAVGAHVNSLVLIQEY